MTLILNQTALSPKNLALSWILFYCHGEDWRFLFCFNYILNLEIYLHHLRLNAVNLVSIFREGSWRLFKDNPLLTVLMIMTLVKLSRGASVLKCNLGEICFQLRVQVFRFLKRYFYWFLEIVAVFHFVKGWFYERSTG